MFNQTGPIGPTLSATPFQSTSFGQSAQNALGAPSPAPQNIFGTQNKTVFGNGNTGFGGIVACAILLFPDIRIAMPCAII